MKYPPELIEKLQEARRRRSYNRYLAIRDERQEHRLAALKEASMPEDLVDDHDRAKE
jgi:hypothetical protein